MRDSHGRTHHRISLWRASFERYNARCTAAVFLLLCISRGWTADVVRADHPRIFITRETIPQIRQRCETTHRDFFLKMKGLCDKGEGGAIQQALCFIVTGERKYAEAAKASVWKDPEQRPGQESIALDWIYDTLTREEVREKAASRDR